MRLGTAILGARSFASGEDPRRSRPASPAPAAGDQRPAQAQEGERAGRRRVRANLLRGLLARAAGVLVFLIGVYIVLRVSGLTQLALTVVGGTGLVGLALGIAFRDITENYLASIFLSVQRPFETGDLVQIDGVTGYVRQLNVRTTVLVTLDGNLAQLPNSTVYKTTLWNYTANPNRREDFVIGIGYDDAIDQAQAIALRVLAEHPAVLKEPEPGILADSLGPATVNLRVYFWLKGREHSWLKVRSSVIRLVKRAYQQAGISMPDESREVVFPKGVPIKLTREDVRAIVGRGREEPGDNTPRPGGKGDGRPRASATPKEDAQTTEADVVVTRAEGGLGSEAGMLREQVMQAGPLQQKDNLLRDQGPGDE